MWQLWGGQHPPPPGKSRDSPESWVEGVVVHLNSTLLPKPNNSGCLQGGKLGERGQVWDSFFHLNNTECLPGLPWWLSGKESACQFRRHGFNPWSGKNPLATDPTCVMCVPQLLGLCSRTWPLCPKACAPQQEKPPQWEACTLQLESSPCSPQLKKSLHSKKDPAQPKIKN